MKKTIYIFLVLMMLFGAVGCLGDDKPTTTTVPATGNVTVINTGQNNNDDHFWMWMYLSSSWHNNVYVPYQHTRTYVTRTVYVPATTRASKTYSSVKKATSFKPISNSEIKARNSQVHGSSSSPSKSSYSPSKSSYSPSKSSFSSRSRYSGSSFGGGRRGR
jgi:hypothetical protein